MPDAALPGERLVAVGVSIFGVGLLAALATILPLFLGVTRLPTTIYLVAVVCCPLGLALALAGVWRSARARRRPRRR